MLSTHDWAGPNELIIPLPVMTTLFVGTEKSDGQSVTVAAHGSVTAGESPTAHVSGRIAWTVIHQQLLRFGLRIAHNADGASDGRASRDRNIKKRD